MLEVAHLKQEYYYQRTRKLFSESVYVTNQACSQRTLLRRPNTNDYFEAQPFFQTSANLLGKIPSLSVILKAVSKIL